MLDKNDIEGYIEHGEVPIASPEITAVIDQYVLDLQKDLRKALKFKEEYMAQIRCHHPTILVGAGGICELCGEYL